MNEFSPRVKLIMNICRVLNIAVPLFSFIWTLTGLYMGTISAETANNRIRIQTNILNLRILIELLGLRGFQLYDDEEHAHSD